MVILVAVLDNLFEEAPKSEFEEEFVVDLDKEEEYLASAVFDLCKGTPEYEGLAVGEVDRTLAFVVDKEGGAFELFEFSIDGDLIGVKLLLFDKFEDFKNQSTSFDSIVDLK